MQNANELMPCEVVGQAGEHWRKMSPAEKAPYEALSAASKAEYARLVSMNPMERIMNAAAAALQVRAQKLMAQVAGFSVLKRACMWRLPAWDRRLLYWLAASCPGGLIPRHADFQT